MAFESTAIRDLVAGAQQKPLAGESNEWLFGDSEAADLFEERADATQIDPRAVAAAPELDPHRGVALPRPFAQLPYPHVDLNALRGQSPTAHARPFDWAGVAKKLALPIGLVSLVSVALGVYFAKTEEAATPTQAAAVAQVEAPAVAATAPSPAAVETAAPPPATVETAAPPEPALATAPAAAAPAPAPGPAADAAAAAAAAAPAPAAVAAAPPEPAPAESLNVEPGSPASRFLAPAPVETTITTAAKPAPAPTAVPELSAAPVTTRPAAKPSRKAAKVAAKPATTSTARSSVRPAQARATKKSVAVADVKIGGKGILQIASSPSMQVWVDGRNSKAMTPVRIRLLAGKHRISLLDNQRGSARSFDVVIKADETTKVSKTF